MSSNYAYITINVRLNLVIVHGVIPTTDIDNIYIAYRQSELHPELPPSSDFIHMLRVELTKLPYASDVAPKLHTLGLRYFKINTISQNTFILLMNMTNGLAYHYYPPPLSNDGVHLELPDVKTTFADITRCPWYEDRRKMAISTACDLGMQVNSHYEAGYITIWEALTYMAKVGNVFDSYATCYRSWKLPSVDGRIQFTRAYTSLPLHYWLQTKRIEGDNTYYVEGIEYITDAHVVVHRYQYNYEDFKRAVASGITVIYDTIGFLDDSDHVEQAECIDGARSTTIAFLTHNPMLPFIAQKQGVYWPHIDMLCDMRPGEYDTELELLRWALSDMYRDKS